ncbi:hypothetical protein FHL15_007302 [Xylaria flabelliformis]|uniref:Fungal-type protein kinase domain-containing protein n=1 Tax=Xylaria flabelliformis TaxID=2512241 RepID=A0A553HUX4_9PEZI|nr:hypothetical protein FHL15_007302 [Xylaria flabelliformis]
MDEGGNYINIDSAVVSSLGKLYLEGRPIASCERLMGNGTACYRGKTPDSDQRNCFLKFKWRWARECPEDELLKVANEKCVWGAISLDYYEEVESTANLRRGLLWGMYRKYKEQQKDDDLNACGHAEHTEETDNFLENRILACVVTSPVGRPLHSFQSVLELL